MTDDKLLTDEPIQDLSEEPSVHPDNLEEKETPAADPSEFSLNRFMNDIADEQRVDVGSQRWTDAGIQAYSGSSGVHGAYGWRHDPVDVPAVLANYGHRRTYYFDEPYRQWNYRIAGRPHGWKPELPGDEPSGEASYLNSKGEVILVSGPDGEHFWLEPLWAVLDSPSVPVMARGKLESSHTIARMMATFLTSSAVGMIRDRSRTDDQPYPWIYGDRATGRVLSTIIEAAKRGCLRQTDVLTSVYYIRDRVLPFYEKTPGIGFFNLQPIPANHHSIGLFNGLSWLLVVFYDAMQALQGHAATQDLANRFGAIVTRYSQWWLDIEETVPGKGFDSPQVFVPRKEFRTGGPLPTIKPILDPANIRFDQGLTWEHWAFRAADIAAKVTGSPVLDKAVDGILNRQGGNPANKKWLVTADGEYAV